MSYSEDFEFALFGQTPRYFMDQVGNFEVAARADDKGKALAQILPAAGIPWEPQGDKLGPFTLIGDTKAKDYRVSAEFLAADGTIVGLIGRFGPILGDESSTNAKGYWFEITAGSGAWKLYTPKKVLAEGRVSFPAGWMASCWRKSPTTAVPQISPVWRQAMRALNSTMSRYAPYLPNPAVNLRRVQNHSTHKDHPSPPPTTAPVVVCPQTVAGHLSGKPVPGAGRHRVSRPPSGRRTPKPPSSRNNFALSFRETQALCVAFAAHSREGMIRCSSVMQRPNLSQGEFRRCNSSPRRRKIPPSC